MPPPGPKQRPILGNLLEFGADTLGFFTRCANDYGDIVSLQIGRWPSLFLNHPDLFETVLLTNNKNFIKHTFFFRHVTGIFGKGLLTNEGAPWLRQRRLMQPAFHRERISGYGATMSSYADRMLAGWTQNGSEDRNVHDDFMKLTMEIATKTLFGEDLAGNDAREISDAFNDAIIEIARRFRRPIKIADWIPLPGNLRYLRSIRRLDKLIFGFIEAKEKHGGGDDLLTMLMEVRDEDGSAMDRKQIRDEAITIFLAGHETTAIALSWTFYLLALNPRAEERAAAAAQSADDPMRSAYLMNVINESMRLYPPAYAFGREALEDCEIGGYRVPAGTTIFMSPWVMHRDERFFADPLAFRPERWENDFAKTLPRFAYLPFGGGPRVCIGNNFALMEAALILAAVLRRYRLQLPPGTKIDPFASITLRPRQGMPMKVERRKLKAES